jgi:hypothetical protein
MRRRARQWAGRTAVEHPGRPPHGIGLLVDHNMGGMAKAILVTDEPDGLRSDWLASLISTACLAVPTDQTDTIA